MTLSVLRADLRRDERERRDVRIAVRAARLAAIALLGVGCGGGETTHSPDAGDADADTDVDGDAGGEDAGPDAGAPIECGADCLYVRAGAAGDGSNWDAAFGALPDALARGKIYFVAAGTYPEYVFDDPEDGAIIRVVRATASDHGTETGWDPSYATGEALFGPLSFVAPDVSFDGRGATRIQGTFQSTVVSIDADRVTLRGCDVDGAFATDAGGLHVDGACTGIGVSGDDVVVADDDVHDAADDGVVVSGSSRFSFVGNRVHALHGCGTDGGCGPCYNGHSDGLEIYAVKDSEFVGNVAWDIESTSTFFFGNWADELGDGEADYCSNVVVANNLLYNPRTGFVMYVEDAAGVRLYDNVIWGLHQGRYGGLSLGTHVRDLEMWNNVILSINFEHVGGVYDAAEHRGDYNLVGVDIGQYPLGAHDLVAGDAGFAGIPDMDGAEVSDPTPEDLTPAAGSPLFDAGYGGDATILIPPTDFFGRPRDADPNIGAIE